MLVFQGRVVFSTVKKLYAFDTNNNLETQIVHTSCLAGGPTTYTWGKHNKDSIATAYTLLSYAYSPAVAKMQAIFLSSLVFSQIPSQLSWEISKDGLEKFTTLGIVPMISSMVRFGPIGMPATTPVATALGMTVGKPVAIVKEPSPTTHKNYSIMIDDEGMEYIFCSICEQTSYNLDDLKHRYCGFCRMFLDK